VILAKNKVKINRTRDRGNRDCSVNDKRQLFTQCAASLHSSRQ